MIRVLFCLEFHSSCDANARKEMPIDNFPIVPEVLLRTRPLPEIESENEKLLAIGNSIISENKLSAYISAEQGTDEEREEKLLDFWEV